MAYSHALQLLPPKNSALWLSSVTAHTSEQIVGECEPDRLRQLSQIQPAYLFEAAAQLCAAHGVLYGSPQHSTEAYIGKLSKLRVYQQHLPDDRLQIRAEQQSSSASSALYQFSVSHHGSLLLDGSLLLVLNHA